MNRQGSASLVVLSLLLFLSTMFLGGAAFIELSVRSLERSRLRAAAHGRLRAAAEAIVGELLSDPTPFADSPSDPVWSAIGGPRGDGISVKLEDVSSRLGLNWIRKEVLADSGALLPGHAAQEVQEARESAGLRLNLDTGFGAFEQGWALRGFENFYTDLVAEPEFAEALMQRVGDYQIALYEHVLAEVGPHVDVVMVANLLPTGVQVGHTHAQVVDGPTPVGLLVVEVQGGAAHLHEHVARPGEVRVGHHLPPEVVPVEPQGGFQIAAHQVSVVQAAHDASPGQGPPPRLPGPTHAGR